MKTSKVQAMRTASELKNRLTAKGRQRRGTYVESVKGLLTSIIILSGSPICNKLLSMLPVRRATSAD